jgi:L-ascorbate metabolism protein UlaG (beta-lactamase superfamily)
MRAILLCLLSFLIVTTGAASAGEIKIAWYGQSMFLIVTPKGKRIVTDPQNLEAYRVQPMKADLVLMSHFHNDHTAIEMIEDYKDTKKVRQYNALKKTGPNGLTVEWNKVDDKLGDVRFFCVPTYHDQMSGLQRGKNGCWVLDIDGIRIVHLGDLGHTLNRTQIKKFGKIDVLMVPVGGVYTLNGLDAFKVCQQLKPSRYIIPMHYGTVVYDELLPLKYFTDECKENDVPVVYFKEKTFLKIDTRSAAPKKASVAVLDYRGPTDEIKLKPKKDRGKDKK